MAPVKGKGFSKDLPVTVIITQGQETSLNINRYRYPLAATPLVHVFKRNSAWKNPSHQVGFTVCLLNYCSATGDSRI